MSEHDSPPPSTSDAPSPAADASVAASQGAERQPATPPTQAAAEQPDDETTAAAPQDRAPGADPTDDATSDAETSEAAGSNAAGPNAPTSDEPATAGDAFDGAGSRAGPGDGDDPAKAGDAMDGPGSDAADAEPAGPPDEPDEPDEPSESASLGTAPPVSDDRRSRRAFLQIAAGFLVLGLFAVGGVFALRGLWREPPPQRAESIGAKLELAAGEVVHVGGGADQSDERLLSGTPLPTGATLRTGPGARALVRLADGSRVFLDEQSRVALAEDTSIELLTGRIWLETPPLERDGKPLIHRFGAAQLSLDDGGASLSLADGQASVYVAEGVAAVRSAAGRREVRSGERAEIGDLGEAAPEVSPVAFWDDWTGGMADRRASGRVGGGSGALYAVDRQAAAGTPALPLTIARQRVDVAIDGQLAETRVDQHFFNPSARDVEGWYWFTVPEDAMLVGFALETDGELVEGEIVERKQAAATYEVSVQTGDSPALLEWIDARTVRARIYPVPALGERRVVVRYQQLLRERQGKLRYSYPLAAPDRRETATIEEFALDVELRGELGQQFTIATLGEATVAEDNRRVTMRRSGYTPRADFELELSRRADLEATPPLRLNSFSTGADQARYVMLRWLPDLDFASLPAPRADVVVVVDTSAFGDAAEHRSRLAVTEALLRSLAEDDRFALMAADLGAELLYPAEGLSPATPEAIGEALAALTDHRPGGATDLGSIFDRALGRIDSAEQPAIVYVGDGLATSGERSTDALSERLRRSLGGSRARLFTVGVGASVDMRLLERLARVGGGSSLRVSDPGQAVARALELSGALKTPTITELELELGAGLDDRFDNAAGKLPRGEELVVLARTHSELPERVTVRGRLGGQDFEREYELHRQSGVLDAVVPKLWAAARVERVLGDDRGPELIRGKVLVLGLEYGLMTPFTSFLALASERAYARQGVERRQRPWDRRLLGDASLAGRARESADPFDASPGELLLGALSAPLGCGAEPVDDRDARSREAKRKEADGDASARAEPPPTSAVRPEPATDQPVEASKGQGSRDFDAVMEEAEPSPAPPGVERHKGEEGRFGDPKGGPPPRGGIGGGGSRGRKAKPQPQPLEAKPLGLIDGLAKAEDVAALGVEADELPGSQPSTAPNLEDSRLEPEPEQAKRELAALDMEQAMEQAMEKAEAPAAPAKADKKKKVRRSSKSPVARLDAQPCSDASARPLAQRKLLWEQRLTRASDILARLGAYEAAAASCELESWRQQRVFLELLQTRVETEEAIELLLVHFAGDGEAQGYLARALLRRLVDPQLIEAVELALSGGVVDWQAIRSEIERATSAEAALVRVEAALAKHSAAAASERLSLDLLRIDLLDELGRRDDAIGAARKLRERGLITPQVAQRLGGLLVAAGREDEARRVYSELVEYDPHSASTRRLLGDIFLRHGWHQEAYRQYRDLVELEGSALDVIRMARAAAAAGRVDEGLRLLRRVASGEGRPGRDDPRRFARLHAAALIASLLAEGGDELPRAMLERELERLQLFDAPGSSLTLLRWHDLEQQLTLGVAAAPVPAPAQADAAAGEGAARSAGERLRRQRARAALEAADGRAAADTGLWAAEAGDLEAFEVRHRGAVPRREVAFERLTLSWDGEQFTVSRERGNLPARAARQAKAEPAEGDDEGAEGAAP